MGGIFGKTYFCQLTFIIALISDRGKGIIERRSGGPGRGSGQGCSSKAYAGMACRRWGSKGVGNGIIEYGIGGENLQRTGSPNPAIL